MSSSGLRTLGVCLLFAGPLAACNNPPEEPSRATPRAPALSAASTLSAFELIRTTRDRAAVSDRGLRVAEALAAKSVGAGAVATAIAAAPADPGGVSAAVDSNLILTYRSANDDLLLIDQSVTRDTASPRDIGLPAATTMFRTTFGGLIEGGGVAALGLNPSAPRLARIVQGEGASGQAPTERVKEYVFTVPRTINGIEVFGAGVEISVHRRGSVARLKVFGPTVNSVADAGGAESPGAVGYSFTPGVDQAAADARVAAEYPVATIKPVGLRYWLSEGTARAVVAPAYMYMVAPTAVIEGKKVKGRGFFVAYSAEAAGRDPVVWPHADPAARGDSGK